jgi:hypothetical protein
VGSGGVDFLVGRADVVESAHSAVTAARYLGRDHSIVRLLTIMSVEVRTI